MAYRVTPYAYRPGSTFLHRLPAGIKLLGLFLISITPFISGPGSLLSALLLILGAAGAKIRPGELLRGSGPMVAMAVFVTAFRSLRFNVSESVLFEISRSGFMTGILFGTGLMLSFSAGALLFSVTTMMELRDSLGKAETILKTFLIRILAKTGRPWAMTLVRGLEAAKLGGLSLGISLMLGFLPRFFEIWEDTDAAYRARAGKKGIPKICFLIPLVTERMIEIAMETAAALESRGMTL